MDIARHLISSAILLATMLPALPVNASPRIEVVSVTVAKPQKNSLDFVGTQLKLVISNAGSIMKIDPDATILHSFVDDKKNDLLESGLKWRQKQNYFTSRGENKFDTANSTIDGDSLVIPVSVNATPASGAMSVTVKGTVGLLVYPPVDNKRHETSLINIEHLFSAPVPLGSSSITFVGYGTGNADGIDYSYANFTSDAAIYKIALFDANSKELIILNTPNPNENLVIENKKLPLIKKIQVQYFSPVKLSVPVQITTGIGL